MNPKRLRLKDGSEIFCSDTHVVHSPRRRPLDLRPGPRKPGCHCNGH